MFCNEGDISDCQLEAKSTVQNRRLSSVVVVKGDNLIYHPQQRT